MAKEEEEIKEVKEYEINTFEDMLNCVTPENIHRFMQDFYPWLDNTAKITEMFRKEYKIDDSVKNTDIIKSGFSWIDDGVPQLIETKLMDKEGNHIKTIKHAKQSS